MVRFTALFFIVLGVIFLTIPFISSFIADSSLSNIKQKQVTCNVILKNPVGIPLFRSGTTMIEDISCVSEEKFICSPFSIFDNLNPLPKDKLNLVFSAGGISKTESVTITEATTKTISIGICIPSNINSGVISVFDGSERTNLREVRF